MDLEEVWRLREEEVYPELFGPVGRGIFPLTTELFSQQFKQSEVDPRWLFLGVFEFPPTAGRPFWLYVTSGWSNPWEDEPEAYDPAGESGSGVEFSFAVSEQGDWAITTLQSMLAFDVLLTAGRFGDRRPLAVGDRIPLGGPLDGDAECPIRHLVVAEPEAIPSQFGLPSGEVRLLGFTGATDPEIKFAKENSSALLIDRLRAVGGHPVTDPRRTNLI